MPCYGRAVKRSEAPRYLLLNYDRLARAFGVDPLDHWAWVWREKPAPRWFVDRVVAAYWPGLPPSDFDIAEDEGLTSDPDLATVATTLLQDSSLKVKVSRAQLDASSRKHPFVRALVKAGITVTEIAEELKVPRSTVQSWYSANNPRPIPRAMVAKLEKRFGVPPSAWASITE